MEFFNGTAAAAILQRNCRQAADKALRHSEWHRERWQAVLARAHLCTALIPDLRCQITHKGQLFLGQHRAPIDEETWAAVRKQLAANAAGHRQRAKAAEPSLLAGLLFDARGERLSPSHAVKQGRRYRHFVSASLITEVGTDRAQGWRLPDKEIEEAVIGILVDVLSSPARLLERCGTSGKPGDQTR
jgi:hypothetical protein